MYRHMTIAFIFILIHDICRQGLRVDEFAPRSYVIEIVTRDDESVRLQSNEGTCIVNIKIVHYKS